MDQALDLALALARDADRRGIAFAHWKSNHHLAAALAGDTDLDVLVAGKDLGTFRAVLALHGGLAMTSPDWGRYPGVEDWLLADPATMRFIHVHLHMVLATGLKHVKHLALPWTEQVLATQRRDPGSNWPMPAAEAELLVLLIRIWAKMPPWRMLLAPRIPRHILDEWRWLETQTTSAAVRDFAGKVGISAVPDLPLKSEVAIVGAARAACREAVRHVRMGWGRALGLALKLNAERLAWRLLDRWRGPVRLRKTLHRGALVAIIGSDGSGKSTVSGALDKWLRYKLDSHLVYMGSGDGRAGWLNGLRRKISGRLRSARRKGSRAGPPQAEAQAGFAARVYRLLDLLLLRRKLRLLRRCRRLAEGGSVILLDRYPQDQFAAISDGPRQRGGRGFAFAAKAEERLLSEARRLGPDLVLRLRVDAATAHARKPDHDPGNIARKCEVIDALEFPQSRVMTIDANAPLDRVLLAAKRAVWSFLLQEVAGDDR